MANTKKLIQAAAGAGGDVGAWDLSYAYYDPSTTAFQINYYNQQQDYLVRTQQDSPRGVFVRNDGLKLFTVGVTPDAVHSYSMSNAFDLSTISYDNLTLDVSGQEGNPHDVWFKPDGTKMYIIGFSSDQITEYDLSTAWDVSTGTYGGALDVSSEDGIPRGFAFKPDGTKVYVAGSTNDSIYEYNLSTAWDVTTGSYSQSLSVTSQDASPEVVRFSDDGLQMFMLGGAADTIFRYELSTAWDVTTASYQDSKNIGSTVAAPTGIDFAGDGGYLFGVGNSSDEVHKFVIGGFDVSAQDTAPTGIFFKPDGDKMYISGIAGDDINEYSLSTDFDLSTASYVRNFSVLGEEGRVEDVVFKPDGTKMFIVGSTGDEVNEFSLSTAWNISTASHVAAFSVSTQGAAPRGLAFKDDGTRMYVTGSTSDAVHQYDLSTAWSVSSATFDSSFSVSSQDTSPYSIFLKDDGTKMYIMGLGGVDINEYDLSTAWDATTATYSQNFSVKAQDTAPMNIYFSPDGDKLFVLGNTGKRVIPYTLGPQ